MKDELAKRYDPRDFEQRLYQKWEQEGFFTPADDRDRPKFSVVIPPPNVTGRLHICHALRSCLAPGPPRIREALRGWPDLSRPGHGQLVPELWHGQLRRRGRVPRTGREALLRRLSSHRLRPQTDRGHDASGDDARRRGPGRSSA